MEFNLEKFNPTVAELQALAKQYTWLSISGVEDKEWYELVKKAQMDLKTKRVHIKKTLKQFREEAIQFQKSVITQEKELVWIIDWVEQELKNERARIDRLKELKKRQKALPKRKELLKSKGIVVDDNIILEMDYEAFLDFVRAKEQEMLELEKERIAKEREELDKARIEIERQKEIENAKKEAVKEAERKAKQDRIILEQKIKDEKEKKKRDIELAKKRAIAEKEKAVAKARQEEVDKQALILKQQKAEKERLEKEKVDKEKKEQDRIKRQELDSKYQSWLEDNEYNELTHIIKIEWSTRKMYKFVWEIDLDRGRNDVLDGFNI